MGMMWNKFDAATRVQVNNTQTTGRTLAVRGNTTGKEDAQGTINHSRISADLQNSTGKVLSQINPSRGHLSAPSNEEMKLALKKGITITGSNENGASGLYTIQTKSDQSGREYIEVQFSKDPLATKPAMQTDKTDGKEKEMHGSGTTAMVVMEKFFQTNHLKGLEKIKDHNNIKGNTVRLAIENPKTEIAKNTLITYKTALGNESWLKPIKDDTGKPTASLEKLNQVFQEIDKLPGKSDKDKDQIKQDFINKYLDLGLNKMKFDEKVNHVIFYVDQIEGGIASASIEEPIISKGASLQNLDGARGSGGSYGKLSSQIVGEGVGPGGRIITLAGSRHQAIEGTGSNGEKNSYSISWYQSEAGSTFSDQREPSNSKVTHPDNPSYLNALEYLKHNSKGLYANQLREMVKNHEKGFAQNKVGQG